MYPLAWLAKMLSLSGHTMVWPPPYLALIALERLHTSHYIIENCFTLLNPKTKSLFIWKRHKELWQNVHRPTEKSLITGSVTEVMCFGFDEDSWTQQTGTGESWKGPCLCFLLPFPFMFSCFLFYVNIPSPYLKVLHLPCCTFKSVSE